MKVKIIALTALCCFLPASLYADTTGVSFLSDYSRLTDGGETGFTKAYVATGATDRLKGMTGVMIDLPEFFIDPDSRYKGVKPGDAIVIGTELRDAMIRGIEENVIVVNEPGEGVDLVSWAVTNVRLEKKKRGVLGYTPVGAVAYGVKKQLSDVVDKTRAFDVVFEFEGTDLDSGEVLFAMVLDLSAAGIEADWGNALMLAEGLGRRIGCQINNSKLPVSERLECKTSPISD